jgi:hypothetical protein
MMTGMPGINTPRPKPHWERHPGPPVPLKGTQCAAHDAPKELCFICDASLREKGRLWCEEHNRYEDRCFECHPALQDKNRS